MHRHIHTAHTKLCNFFISLLPLFQQKLSLPFSYSLAHLSHTIPFSDCVLRWKSAFFIIHIVAMAIDLTPQAMTWILCFCFGALFFVCLLFCFSFGWFISEMGFTRNEKDRGRSKQREREREKKTNHHQQKECAWVDVEGEISFFFFPFCFCCAFNQRNSSMRCAYCLLTYHFAVQP